MNILKGSKPNAISAYTVILLQHEQHYLLLQRAHSKAFAPGRWTGVGGRVEAHEWADLTASAERELQEETGILPGQVENFVLRRGLIHARPGEPLTTLLYFTGYLPLKITPTCSEGTLTWVTADQMAGLDIIETTQAVLPQLVTDLGRDPAGGEPLRLAVAHYRPDGRFVGLTWDVDEV